MPNAETEPLFNAAARAGIAFCLGYAELCVENGRFRHKVRRSRDKKQCQREQLR